MRDAQPFIRERIMCELPCLTGFFLVGGWTECVTREGQLMHVHSGVTSSEQLEKGIHGWSQYATFLSKRDFFS